MANGAVGGPGPDGCSCRLAGRPLVATAIGTPYTSGLHAPSAACRWLSDLSGLSDAGLRDERLLLPAV